ncbi:MAG: RNA methyltransferase [Pirellulaceae bacterium]|nr:RNA methyltransferase [Pirellulaceae bacterium]
MTPITSPQNSRVKDAVRLRDRRHRRKQGRIIIDGARELLRAIASGVEPVETFVCPALCHSAESKNLLEMLPRPGGEVFEVGEAVFDKLSFGDRAEGVLAVAAAPQKTLDSLMPAENALIAVLEAVEKPGNLGAVLRSADAAGLSALIAADPRTDLYNPNAIRASLGTIFTMPVREATGGETLAWLRRYGFRIVAARVDGSVPYTEADYRGRTAVVLGSEAEGLSALWRGGDIRAVRLPMLGAADSLNVSAAAAVLFYEALRQRSA